MSLEFVLIQMTGVLFETVITYSYFEAALSDGKNNRKYGRGTYLFYAGMFVLLRVINSTVHNLLVAPISLFGAILMVSLAYQVEWKNRISLSLLLLLLFVLSEMGTGMLMSLISSRSVADMEEDLLLYFQGMFVSQMLVFIVVKTVWIYQNRHNYQMSAKTWLGLMIIPVTSAIAVYGIAEAAYQMESRKICFFVLAIAVCLIVANGFIFYLFEKELRNEETKLRYQFMEKQLEEEKEYYKQLTESQEEIRKLSHDMKNSLITILGILKEGNQELVENTIREMLHEVKSAGQRIYTGRVAIDTMLNMKEKRMRAEKISFEPVCIMSSESKFDEMAFCIFMGNALDNAIEANERVEEGKRYIRMRLIERGNVISCYMENAKSRKQKSSGKRTTKGDPVRHGYGLTNMRIVLEKHGGNLETQEKEDRYIVSAVMPVG